MKKGWKYVKLGDIATFTRGLTYSKNDEVGISSKIVLRSNNVNLSDGQLNFDDLKYLSESFVIPLDKKVKKGSLLMCMSNGSKAHLGKVALIEEDLDYAFGGFMGLVSHSDLVEDKFFWYSLITPAYKDFIRSLSAGANINNLKIKDLETFTIPLPPLSEQQSIVAHLDASFAEIDALKAKAAEEVANAKAMFDAALREEMTPKEGWEEKKLNEISKYSIGLTYKPSDVSENGTIVLRSANIQNDQLDLSDIVRVTCNIKDSLYVEENDILMCSRNGSARLVGKVAMLPKMKEKMTYGTFMMIIKSTYSPFLFYFFKSDIFRNQIKHGEANMINQITRYMLDEIVVGLPSPIVQQRIVAKLDTLRSHLTELEQKYNLIAANCDALKQAILRETFE